MKFYVKNSYLMITAVCICSVSVACKKFVQADVPKTQVGRSVVFTNNETALSAIRGIYSEMSGTQEAASGGTGSISLLAALSADEVDQLTGDLVQMPFYTNSLLPENPQLRTSLWAPFYKYIYSANSILEGLQRSTGLTPVVKEQIEGEARFVRAFCYFYLVNLFGEVPLATTTDYVTNNVLYRSAENDVYALIVKDLLDAKSMLARDYSYSAGERIRPNSWAAVAMLSRVYLYQKNWSKAEAMSSLIIDQTKTYRLTTLNEVFLKNSDEAIWQLMPVIPGLNTMDGQTFKPFAGGSVALSANLVDRFQKGDLRRKQWIDSLINEGSQYYYPQKYKVQNPDAPLTEYQMILRLSEQFLIRAEARAHLSKLDGAKEDLDIIRNRAGLKSAEATDQASILYSIAQERSVELFTEWGHRWMDLKRTNQADEVLKPIKGKSWRSTAVLYPIPESENINNPNLKPQNMGY